MPYKEVIKALLPILGDYSMTNDFDPAVVPAIRALRESVPAAKRLFNWMATRGHDATETSLDRMAQKLGISRSEAVALARQLQDAHCGEFVVGRRGQKSRFRWAYSCIGLGHAAAGEQVELVAASDPIAESEEEALDPQPASPLKLTIPQAKAGLAAYFGVSPDNIEITIKA
jgi:hypothetical protein